MKIINIKLEKDLINRMDEKLDKHGYSTREEFIIAAIKNKIRKLKEGSSC